MRAHQVVDPYQILVFNGNILLDLAYRGLIFLAC